MAYANPVAPPTIEELMRQLQQGTPSSVAPNAGTQAPNPYSATATTAATSPFSHPPATRVAAPTGRGPNTSDLASFAPTGPYPVNSVSQGWVDDRQNYLDALKLGRVWDPDQLPADLESTHMFGVANNGRVPTAGQDSRGYHTTTDGRGPNGEFGFFTDDSGVAPGLNAGTSYQGANGQGILDAIGNDPGLSLLIDQGLADPAALAAELRDPQSPLGQHFNRPAIFDAVELASGARGMERPDWWNDPMIYTPESKTNWRISGPDGMREVSKEEYDAYIQSKQFLHGVGGKGRRAMEGVDPHPLGMNETNPRNGEFVLDDLGNIIQSPPPIDMGKKGKNHNRGNSAAAHAAKGTHGHPQGPKPKSSSSSSSGGSGGGSSPKRSSSSSTSGGNRPSGGGGTVTSSSTSSGGGGNKGGGGGGGKNNNNNNNNNGGGKNNNNNNNNKNGKR